jgi:hypothetical protein
VPDPTASDGGATWLVTAYKYAARDLAAAESMADAMAAFGYAEVGARPTRRRHLRAISRWCQTGRSCGHRGWTA